MNWIPLNHSEFSLPKRDTLPGQIEMEQALSPFDIPQAVKGEWDSNRKTYVISFQYMVPDETTKIESADGISVKIGKHSKRLYEICLTEEYLKKKIKEIDQQFQFGQPIKIGQHFVARSTPWSDEVSSFLKRKEIAPKDRRQVAKDVIERNRVQIFSDLLST